jgi:hypothetical protein
MTVTERARIREERPALYEAHYRDLANVDEDHPAYGLAERGWQRAHFNITKLLSGEVCAYAHAGKVLKFAGVELDFNMYRNAFGDVTVTILADASKLPESSLVAGAAYTNIEGDPNQLPQEDVDAFKAFIVKEGNSWVPEA